MVKHRRPSHKDSTDGFLCRENRREFRSTMVQVHATTEYLYESMWGDKGVTSTDRMNWLDGNRGEPVQLVSEKYYWWPCRKLLDDCFFDVSSTFIAKSSIIVTTMIFNVTTWCRFKLMLLYKPNQHVDYMCIATIGQWRLYIEIWPRRSCLLDMQTTCLPVE